MAIKRFRPSICLTFIMTCWSAAMIGQGFVKSYSGLLATRALLGLFEGGLFPGVNYYITRWYRRNECGFRMALFFSAATLAGAFGGILARGIAEMSGICGLSAWSWIFILEGLISILISFTAYWAIFDYPNTARFLEPQERDEVMRRLKFDSGRLGNNDFNTKYVWQAIRDWKIYIHMLICMAGFCPIYSFALFLPTIVKNMGYTANNAQLMTVPPYVCACFFTIAASYVADRVQRRGVFLLAFQLVALLGFALLAGSGTSVQYTGTIFAAIGIYPQIPLGLAWNSGNIGGSLKRGTGIAMQVMGGNCGGIIASYVYLSRDGPRYVKGHSILIGFVG
jgi:MFS family permease